MTDPCRVLLIEDNRADARLFRETLSDADGAPFEVTLVERLSEGLARLADDDVEFDIVVIDMSLPDSIGMETFERVNEAAPMMPIVVMSGMTDEEFAVGAVKAGAEDYLIKGRDDPFWLARTLRYAVERKRERLRRQATEYELDVRNEQFRIAREIQQRLFPSTDPLLPGFDISGASFPADETGGDYFDYLKITGGYFGVVIGDVSGHGAGPALLMAETHAYLRAVTRTYSDCEFVIGMTNQLLVEDIEGDRLVTLFFLRLHPETRTIQFVGAGHQGFLLDADGGVAVLEPQNPPLGIEANAEFDCSGPQTLKPGDTILLSTDGTWEAESANGGEYGIPRMLEIVGANRHLPAAEIIRLLREDVQSFAAIQNDDMTVVVMRVVSG